MDNNFKQRTLDLLSDIWKVEGMGSIKALTLKAWLIQNYGGVVLPEIDKAEREAAGERTQPDVQAPARRMQSFRHPASQKAAAAPAPVAPVEGKSSAPLNSGAGEEQPLSAPTPEEQLPGTQTLSQPSNTPQAPQAPGQNDDALVAPEAPAIELTPQDAEELSTLSPGAVLKKYSRKELEAYLNKKGLKAKQGASDRQLAAQFLSALEKGK